jgi:hypothetical protein
LQEKPKIVCIKVGKYLTIQGDFVSRHGSRATVLVDGREYEGELIENI